MRLSIDVHGDVQLDRELLRFADRAQDVSPLFTALADDFLDLERRQFSSEGRYSGGWAELSARYAARKAKRYPGAKILHAEGDLEASLTRRGARNAVRSITRSALEVGTTDPNAVYHQHGTPHMPQRRPVEFAAADRDRWVKALQRFLVTGQVST